MAARADQRAAFAGRSFGSDHVTKQVKDRNTTLGRRPIKKLRRKQTSGAAPPTLLIVLHVPKTGGTALTTILNGFSWSDLYKERRQSGKHLRLPHVIWKGQLNCFYDAFPSLFPHERPKRCQHMPPPWHRSDLAMHLHTEDDIDHFWATIEPKLPELRLLYAAHNGTFVTTVAIREPRSHIRSHYKMWPPRVDATPGADHSRTGGVRVERHRSVTIMPFHAYLQSRSSEAWGRLAKNLVRAPGGGEIRAPTCSADVVTLARRRLRAFDVVGLTNCARRHYRELGRRLGWSCFVDEAIMDAAEAHSHNEWYKPHEPDPAFRAFAEASADEELSPDAEAALDRAAACDEPIWADGLRRAGMLDLAAADGPDSGAEPGKEEAWALEIGRRGLVCSKAGASSKAK